MVRGFESVLNVLLIEEKKKMSISEEREILMEEAHDRELARLRPGESQIDVTDDDEGFPTSLLEVFDHPKA